MKRILFRPLSALQALALVFALGAASNLGIFAQSRRLPPTTNEKKNKRPDPNQPSTEQKEETPPDIVGKPQEAETVKVITNLVNVDAVVYNKKSGQIVTGLKKENFAIFEDGQKVDITNFDTPEAPITVSVVVEYSKLSEKLGYYGSGGFDAGPVEGIKPMAYFLSQFVRPPNDYVSVIAYDLRPTPLTDFTNDPRRLQEVITLLLR